eukprot:COSAG05_NODE_524_length_8999_cov_4.187528_5_plen_128_part_00
MLLDVFNSEIDNRFPGLQPPYGLDGRLLPSYSVLPRVIDSDGSPKRGLQQKPRPTMEEVRKRPMKPCSRSAWDLNCWYWCLCMAAAGGSDDTDARPGALNRDRLAGRAPVTGGGGGRPCVTARQEGQ